MEKTDGRLSGTVTVLILCLALGTVAQAGVQNGLLVAHCFDDLIDNSGNGHNAVLGDGAYISGGLLYLDGDNDYADIGASTFGPVNPLVDALSDFTIAVAYACTSTATGEDGSMIVSIGPASGMGTGDLNFGTGNDGQSLDHWYAGGFNSAQSGVGYANGSVHMVILTYQTSSNTYTFYHQTGTGGVSHGSGTVEWGAEWNEAVDYTPRLGAPRNSTLRGDEGVGFFPDMNGQIDFFAMWNRVLTTAEMEDVMDICGPPDTDPPTPDPPTWASAPTALGPYSIGMTVNPVTDPSGVQYFFDETTGAGHDSVWQAGQDYTDSGLDPCTPYTYKVKARDLSANQNATSWSDPCSATTDLPDTTAPTPNPPTWASPPAAADPWTVTMTANTGTDDNSIQYYFEETSGNGGHSSSWQSNNSYTDQFLTPQTQYTYQVKMRDLSPQLNVTGWSDPCSATTDELPILECPDGDLDDDCVCESDDLLIFAAQWLDPPGCVGHPNDCADLNEQDGVDGADFVVLVADWQKSGIPIALVINEMMASNTATIADEDDEYDDWIEIFNPAPYPVSMGGMFLEDDGGNIWTIPPNVGINSGEHLLFWADDGWLTGDGNYHTNFKLSKDGDGVTLYDTDGSTIIDTKSFSSMDADISYGRYTDATDNWYDMADPTPGSTNTMGMSGKVYCSRPAGIFTSAFSLGLTTKSPAATIYYTTSGSEPNEFTGQLYTGLIPVANTTVIRAAAFQPGYSRGPVETNTYISLDDVYSQPALPAGFPDVWHVGVDWEPDFPVNYEMHPDVITEYAAHLEDAFTSIPTMSLVMDLDDLFGLENGIYSNSCWPGGGEDGPLIENPASVELIHSDGTEGFDIDCGARIYGAGSRNPEENLKHTFRLLFKGIYGPTKLSYPFFEDSPVEQFDTIVLRGGNNFKWNNHGSEEYYREIAQYIRDNWAKDSQLAMGHPASHSNYVHLYLNGLYWGLYMPCERPSGPFLADHLGGEREDWDALNSGEAIEGDRVAWETMMTIANGGLSSQSAYDNIQEYLDVKNLIDFVIVEHYTQNTDWAESNWYAGRIRLPGAGYKLFVWDTEYAFFDEYENTVEEDFPDSPRRLYIALCENPEFRLLFADHLHRHLFNGGLMTPAQCAKRWMRRANELYDAIIGESARWGDSNMDDHGGLPYTRDGDWIPALDWIVNDFMSVRTAILLNQYRNITPYPLYPSVAAPVFNINGSYQHGGYVAAGASLTMTKSGGGTIWYTTDPNDPRLQGGAISPSASDTLPYTLNDTRQIKARVLDSGTWSALNEAIFAVGPVAEYLRITEIMYNVDDPNHEYIELKNIGPAAIDLNLVKFTDGIDFTFPSLSLPAGDYCVVVRNAASFALRYPSFTGTIAGEFIGAINNAGERIELVDALGQVIHNFRFKDGWYPITDGEDFSLNIIDPCDSDPNSWEYAIYWQPSSVAGGTPSADDTGHVASPGDIVINEVMTHTDSAPQDWIELHNTTSSPIVITDWFLSDNDNNFKRYRIGVSGPVTILANGYKVFTQDDHFGNYLDPGSDVQFAFSELGETVYLCSGSGGELVGGFCTKEDFKASEDEVSFGRYTKSATAGYDVDFVSMSSATYEVENTTGAKVGPIVITEIMYHPPDPNSYAEYVEIRNISGTTVALDDWLLSDESGGIEYYIPSGTSLTNGSYLLLAKNKVAFENVFGSVGVTVLEWLGGRLNNAGEKIQISKPGTPEPGGFVPYIRVDRVNYSDGSHGQNFRELNYNDPWPTSPDGTGQALDRVTDGNYGNDVANWTAATPTPGY